MSEQTTDFAPPRTPARAATSGRMALGLALALLTATFFLISPPSGGTYPGAIPWSDHSLLRPLTETMSFGGLLVSVRGVEIKDLALHLTAVAGLILLCVSAVRGTGVRAAPRSPVRHAQVLLALWAGLSLTSSLWAGDADLARGQAILYAFGLAWAIALATTLPAWLVPALLHGLMIISALAASLCTWYYYERNPHHRPGFPLGNPITLAAAIVPGVLIAIGVLGGALSRQRAAGQRRVDATTVAALLSLPPMAWCLRLTYGRGALLALGAGLATFVVYRVSRRWRWGLAAVLGIGLVAAGAWWFSTSHLDVTMARGATMRFRFYAWRYAAELWNADSWTRIAGQGAGAYPRLAGAYAVHDRALDPAAFMGEIVEHAHNELFEILAEIGLVGSVTWVGGMLATLAAVAVCLRSERAGRRRWLLVALLAGVVALLADAAFGSALRLPGVGAIFFTLIGALWAACRARESPAGGLAPLTDLGARTPRGLKPAAPARWIGLVCLIAGAGGGWLAIQNWIGVQYEYAAHAAFDQGDYVRALEDVAPAEKQLLDPVRVIAARKLQLQCVFATAMEAVQAWHSPAASRPEARRDAVGRVQAAHEEALRLRGTVPSLEQTDAVAARCAEWMARLMADVDASAARAWAEQAERSWRRQRQRSPYDVETLLALTRYRATLPDHLALLRDALRFGDTQGAWRAALEQLAAVPRFEDVLADFLAAAGPITPQTDADAIVASMAPEAYRLAGAWHGLRREYAQAAAPAARAAQLYEPLRARFPTLQAVALMEQADYILRGDDDGADAAAALLRRAIDTLPRIQPQQYDERARPFRFRLALCLLAGEHTEEGLETLRAALGPTAKGPDLLESMLQRLVRDAAAAGVPPERLERARRALCPRYPTFCGAAPGG